MADPFYAEIRIFAFSYPPMDWIWCNGQELPSNQLPALYALLGNQFGGTAPATFCVPNLQGSAVYGFGNGPGLTPRTWGKSTGTATVALSQSQLPNHQHSVTYYGPSNHDLTNVPTQTAHLARTIGQNDFTNTDTYDTTLSYQMIGPVGGTNTGATAPHENRQPYLTFNFCICAANGIWPEKPD